jgi:lysosomal acid phosphatase
MNHLHYWYAYAKYNNDLAKAFNTNKLKRVISDFDDRIKNPTSKPLKWTFISCHDTDMIPLSQYLDLADSKCIEELYRKGSTQELNCNYKIGYASSIIFELHSEEGKNFQVKIRKDGKYVYLCGRPSQSCPYEEWKEEIVKTYVDVNRVCNGPGEVV